MHKAQVRLEADESSIEIEIEIDSVLRLCTKPKLGLLFEIDFDSDFDFDFDFKWEQGGCNSRRGSGNACQCCAATTRVFGHFFMAQARLSRRLEPVVGDPPAPGSLGVGIGIGIGIDSFSVSQKL
jgi:hypothetical protein